MNHCLDDVLQSERIPTLPAVALQVVRLAQSPEPDFRELSKVIRADPAIASRVMRVANSALFGLPQKPKSIEAALPILGVTQIRTLILGFSLADTSCQHAGAASVYHRLWRNALTQAGMAETIANRNPQADPANWFLSGLLLDIGQLALLNCLGDDYQEVITADGFWLEPVKHERAALGFDHVQVTCSLLERWKFEAGIIEDVALHHDDSVLDGAAPKSLSQVAALALVSRGTSLLLEADEENPERREQVFADFARILRIPEQRVPAIIEEAIERTEETAVAFRIEMGEPPSSIEVLLDANATLSSVAIESQERETRAVSALSRARSAFSRLKKQIKRVKARADRDALTGVFNRGHLDTIFEAWLTDCREVGAAAMLFLDVDDFKQINDQFGHDAGDEAIRTVAEVLKASTRMTDEVFRYGGDEFVVLLQDASEEQVGRIAERIRKAVAEAAIDRWPGISLSTSVGAVHVTGNDEQLERDSIVATADRAMYRAKDQGGNNVVILKTLAT